MLILVMMLMLLISINYSFLDDVSFKKRLEYHIRKKERRERMLLVYQCFCFVILILPWLLGSCTILSVVCDPFNFDDFVRILVTVLVMGVVIFVFFHICFLDTNSFIFKIISV
ncbi:hypothetical protein [Fructobacillus cardui]|uniref:hypothetical protein n=1 Tax=Fructobacillus cardui TaxID=2893170 RepID=UPI00200B10B4|nr:hypothetical protein [Fructobacillus cardui]MCK8627053.1 hypothetical protein [Fructobacillus cardui]